MRNQMVKFLLCMFSLIAKVVDHLIFYFAKHGSNRNMIKRILISISVLILAKRMYANSSEKLFLCLKL